MKSKTTSGSYFPADLPFSLNQIEEKLRQTEETLRLLFKNNPHPMWIYDLESLAFLDVNNAAIRRYGYSREEFLSMTIKNIMPPEDIPALIQNVSNITEGLDHAGVWRHRKKDGAVISVEITAHTIEFEGKRAELVLAYDIAEQKSKEAQLLQATKEWCQTFDSISDFVSVHSSDFRLMRVNKALADFFGIKPKDMIGKHCYEVFHGSDKPMPTCPHVAAMKLKKDVTEEVFEKKIGFPLLVTASPIFDESGKVVASVHVARDIRAQKTAEDKIKETLSLLRATLDSTTDGILVTDRSGMVSDYNKRFLEMWRIPDTLIETKNSNHTLAVVMNQLRDPKSFLVRVRELHKRPEEESFEVVQFKDGRIFEEYSKPQRVDEEIVGRVWSFRDVTEQRKTAEGISHMLSMLQATLESTADGILVVDKEGKIAGFNKKFLEMWRIPESVIESRDDNEALAFVLEQLKDPDGFLTKVKELYQQPTAESFDTLVFKDGRVFERYSKPQRIGESYGGRVWSFRDVTSRKYMEEGLVKSEEGMRLLIDSSPDCICHIALDGNFLSMNRAGCKLNYIDDAKEVIGTSCVASIIQNREEAEEAIRRAAQGITSSLQYQSVNKRGEKIWWDSKVTPVIGKDGAIPSILRISRDITERKKIEEREKVLYEFSRNVTAKLDLDHRFKAICQTIGSLGYDMCLITLLKGNETDIAARECKNCEGEHLCNTGLSTGAFVDQPSIAKTIKDKKAKIDNHIDRLQNPEAWQKPALQKGCRSSAIFPMMFEQNIIGVLILFRANAQFPPAEVEFLQDFANQSAVHINNSILMDQTKGSEKKTREEMEVTAQLLSIAETAVHTTNMDRLMEQVIRGISRIIRCDICLAYLWDKEEKYFKPIQSHGLANDVIPHFRTEPLDRKVNIVVMALEKRGPVVISIIDPDKQGEESEYILSDESLRDTEVSSLAWIKDKKAIIIIPLMSREEYLGLMVAVYTHPWACRERDKKVLKGISHQITSAIKEAQLYKDSIDKAMELAHQLSLIKVMHDIDVSILSTLEMGEILETSVRLISRILTCDGATVTLIDDDRKGFVYKAGFGIAGLAKGAFVPFKETSATEVIKTGIPQYISNLMEIEEPLALEKMFIKEGFLSHIRLPLTVRNKVIGVLNVGSKREAAFTPENLSTLEKIASQMSVALENARLLTDLEDLFLGTVKTLSSAIDAKSPWTAGHSARVTEFACKIGKEMGFSDKELKDLELAGLLHDIGKIGTYEAILDKAGRLTDEEMNIVRLHPAKGADMLAPIRQIKHIIPAVKYHHEFYNGKGYPDGLKGEEIPLAARIMAVADAADAMAADRPYRKGRPMSEVLLELKKCAGEQFDPKVVEVFLKIHAAYLTS